MQSELKDKIYVVKKYVFFDKEFKTIQEAADFFEVTQPFASYVFGGKRSPSKKMLDKVGLKMTKTVTKKIVVSIEKLPK